MRPVLIFVMMLMAPTMAHATCSSGSASGLSFGTYTGTALTNSVASVTINCSTGWAYSIGLSAGTGNSATVTTRKMSSGANQLGYAMYQDATRSTNWGNTIGVDARSGTTTVSGGSATVLNIYATLTSLQYPTPGAYLDTIIASELNSPGFTGTFTVTATVQATCSISATTLDFGVYTGSLVSANSTITATCTSTTPYNIGLSVGNAPGATVTTRKMAEPGGALQAYSLFRDSGRSANWGNTIGTDTVSQMGSGSAQAITVYGRVAAGQSLTTPGTYTDTIVATLTY